MSKTLFYLFFMLGIFAMVVEDVHAYLSPCDALGVGCEEQEQEQEPAPPQSIPDPAPSGQTGGNQADEHSPDHVSGVVNRPSSGGGRRARVQQEPAVPSPSVSTRRTAQSEPVRRRRAVTVPVHRAAPVRDLPPVGAPVLWIVSLSALCTAGVLRYTRGNGNTH